MNTSLRRVALPLVVLGLSMPTSAQQAATGTGEVNLTATSANVYEPGTPARIRILRWSTDEERAPIVAALNPPARGAAQAGADAGGTTRGARGAARGAAGRGARGARGGRGEAGAAPVTPVAALTAALGKAPTIGYIWTNDVTGYSIKYAWRAALPDGSERIVLATDRRLGAHTAAWRPVAAVALAATDYEFTLVEIRLDAKGLGEGKTSLTTKVIVDNEARTVALENYAATPAILQNVKR